MRRWRPWVVLGAGGAALVVAGVLAWSAREDLGQPRTVVVPELSALAEKGQEAYDRHCAECHGPHAAGTPVGPPLVHPIYRPAHHADVAFTLAVQRGVRAHHWRFGDMPAQPEVSAEEIAAITRYLRELQRANDIE